MSKEKKLSTKYQKNIGPSLDIFEFNNNKIKKEENLKIKKSNNITKNIEKNFNNNLD